MALVSCVRCVTGDSCLYFRRNKIFRPVQVVYSLKYICESKLSNAYRDRGYMSLRIVHRNYRR